MFLLGHLGIGLGFAWFLSVGSPRPWDYRLVLLGTILPDLIDKPLGIGLGLETRLWAHTVLFLFVLLALSLRPAWAAVRPLGFGGATHLLLDGIWNRPYVALYPAEGWWFPPAGFDPEFWFEALLTDPLVQAGEIGGFLILVAFAWTHGIRTWAALGSFLRKGDVARATGDPK